MTFVHDDVLHALLRRVRSGQNALVTGTAGAGRTTVLAELSERLRSAGTTVVEVTGTGTGDEVPLAALLTHPTLRPRSAARWGIAEATGSFLELLGSARGVVVVDDAHEVDASSLAVVTGIARQRRDQVRVVAATPAGLLPLPPWEALVRGAVVHPVRPLGVAEVATVLGDVLGGQVEGGLAATVAGRAGGNPRLAKALARTALEAGVVERIDGRWSRNRSFDTVATSALVHGAAAGLTSEQRQAIEMLAWLGLVSVEHARDLVGEETLVALEIAGLVAVHERSGGPMLVVSPPALGQALRLDLSPARRALLRLRAAETLEQGVPPGGLGPAAAPVPVGLRAHDRPAHQQIAVVAETLRTRVLLAQRDWEQRHDVATALPLLWLALLEGVAGIDVDAVFAGTGASPADDLDDVAAFVLLRGQWAVSRGGTMRDGLLHDPGPSGRLVIDGLGEAFVDHLSRVYSPDGVGPQTAGDYDEDGDVPAPVRRMSPILRGRQAIESGDPERALNLLADRPPVEGQRPFEDQADDLRGDALLMVGQVDDAVAWARERVDAAYESLSTFALRLAARGLASALFVRGQDVDALSALSVTLRTGRLGLVPSVYDERIFGLAAVLHARAGHIDLARTLLDDLDRTQRLYVPPLDFMHPWARMEVEHATPGNDAASAAAVENLWTAGERRWERGQLASGLLCWALTPLRLDGTRLARLEEAAQSVQIPILRPVLRLHRQMTRGTSTSILAARRALKLHGPLADVALDVALDRTREAGDEPLSAEDARTLAGHRRAGGGDGADGGEPLTARESEIVGLARDGLTNREIASRLFLSVRTVESHLYRGMQKLGISDRNQLRGGPRPTT